MVVIFTHFKYVPTFYLFLFYFLKNFVQAVKSSSIKARLDVSLRKPGSYAVVEEFTLACNFPSALTGLSPITVYQASALKATQ